MDVGWLAAEALAAIGPKVAVPLLRGLINRMESAEFRQGAHHILGELRQTKIADEITDVYTALNDLHSDVEIIADAEHALARLKSVADE